MTAPSARIVVILGRPPSRASLLPAVLDDLRKAGHEISTHVIGDGPPAAAVGKGADLVVLRALDLAALDALAELEDAGTRFCNTVAATRAARDKIEATRLLAAAGVPLPPIVPAANWDEALAAADGRAVVIKAAAGSRGEGILHTNDPPAEPPFPGPYVVEQHVRHDGIDRKLYVAGEQVFGVERSWPPRSLADKLGRRFSPTAELHRLALAAGRALGLELYGTDVLLSPDGPVLVDVNAFPGYKGVPEAPCQIAAYLDEAARTRALL